jgi:cytidine deaminase
VHFLINFIYSDAKIQKTIELMIHFYYFCSKIKIFMEQKLIESKIQVYQMEELSASDRQLVDKAMLATNNSYSKYSKFSVGACIRLKNGLEIIGANQENAAYPVCMCAERSALFAAGAQYPDEPVVAIAIAARNSTGEFTTEPVSPCGSCRQAMIEIEQRYHQALRILLYGTKGVYVIDSIRDIMPLSFTDDQL